MFQGQLWTQETGLNDYRNRVELPTMGVFLQPDPIGFKGDAANIYRFCNNNAVNHTDPMGLYIVVDLTNASKCFVTDLELPQTAGGGAASPRESDKPGGNYSDPNIEHHIKTDQAEPGDTKYTNGNVDSGVAKPTIDWWMNDPKYANTKVVLGELEHVSRYLWSLEKGDLGKAVRAFNANPNADQAKVKLENERLTEKIAQRNDLHGRNLQGNLRHDVSRNPELMKTMTPSAIESAIRNVKPLEDPRPSYLGY